MQILNQRITETTFVDVPEENARIHFVLREPFEFIGDFIHLSEREFLYLTDMRATAVVEIEMFLRRYDLRLGMSLGWKRPL